MKHASISATVTVVTLAASFAAVACHAAPQRRRSDAAAVDAHTSPTDAQLAAIDGRLPLSDGPIPDLSIVGRDAELADSQTVTPDAAMDCTSASSSCCFDMPSPYYLWGFLTTYY